jgi:hypothetical protein
MLKGSLLRLATTTTVLMLSLGITVGVKAQVSSPPSAAQHCVMELLPVQSGQNASVAQPRGCYSTFSEAIAVATGGRARLPQNFSGAPTQAMLAPSSPVTGDVHGNLSLSLKSGNSLSPKGVNNSGSGTVIGIDWNGVNYTGPSLTWYDGTGQGCNNGYTYGQTSMPSGWNQPGTINDLASSHGYANCWHYKHFQNTSYNSGYPGYPYSDCNASCPSMGVMQLQTQSETWNYYP